MSGSSLSVTNIDSMNSERFTQFLEENGYCSSNVCKVLEGHKINGKNFMRLTEEHLKHMFPEIGIVLDLLDLQKKLEDSGKVNSTVSFQGLSSPEVSSLTYSSHHCPPISTPKLSQSTSVSEKEITDVMPHTFCNMPHSITPIKEEPLVTPRNVSSNSNSMPDNDDEIFEDAPEFSATDVSSGSLHHHENANSLTLTPKSNVYKFEEGSPILYEKHSSVVKGVQCLPDHGEQMISPSVSGIQNTSKVTEQSFKEYINIKSLNSDNFAEWLRLQDLVATEVIQAFKANHIDGQCFLELTEDHLKSIVKPLGVRMKLTALQKKVSKKYEDKYKNADVTTLECEEFGCWLDVHNFSSEVCQAFKEEEIDGTLFLELNKDQLTDIVKTEETVIKLQELRLNFKSPESMLSALLESYKLSPMKWLTHFNEVHIVQPEHVTNHQGSVKTYKELLHYITTSEEKLSIQRLLNIPDEKLNSAPQSDVENKKKEFIEFLEILGLTEHYPKKLKVKDAMLIRMETLDIDKYTDQIKLLPYVILQKIFMFDNRSRVTLLKETNVKSGSIRKIHPLDCFLTLIHCCDNFLCQELLLKISVCQMAMPIVLPNPHDGSIVFLLWAMRSIIKSWKTTNNDKGVVESKECRIIEYPAPLISFLKVGKPKYSKSNIINIVISELSKEDFFFNWNCEGGAAKKIFIDGLCEICCYLPSGKSNVEDFYSDILLFLNLRGDAQKHTKQTQFVKKVSYMIFLLLNEDDINESSLKLLEKLSKVPGGVILMFPDLENEQPFKRSDIEQNLSGMTIIKLAGKNEFEIKNEIRNNILAKLKLPAVKHCKSLNECTVVAKKLQIFVDEDDEDCTKGKSLAQALMDKVRSIHITKAKENMLPLQGSELWHKWATFDKESFRHIHGGVKDEKTYTIEMESKKKAVRESQCKLSKELTPVMKGFLDNLLKHKGNIKFYFLQWLKMLLDDYSREELPDLSAAYHKTRAELLKATEANKDTESEETKILKKWLKDQNDELINASFGLEHLFREMGQVYEARMDPQLKVSQDLKDEVKSYPQIVVELMEEGYPVELMDGDAAHVPKTWVLAVIKTLRKKHAKSRKIFVISVLGIQSTGKSTLLNTVFGLHFNVSAGRCTRGAYFQLLPLNDTLRAQTNLHHILIVDTEGLRAPELQYKESQKHDNELATFVIGLADLTIINIYGETPGDLADILETAVHAFIRMKEVEIQLSCHFVHQNVPAVMAEKKGKFGRQQFQDKLDLMTRTAAEGENLGNTYKFFQDVIHFNSDTDVMYFPSLWKGDPPMAPVNQGYSDKARSLKKSVISLAENKPYCTFNNFETRVNKLWEAVLRERFVFSFKNTLQVLAYNELDTQYSQWAWEFKHKMLEWQNESTNMINSCDPSKVKETTDTCLMKAIGDLDKTYSEIYDKMETFFEKDDKADTLAQWKKQTETRLEAILEQHKKAAEKHCNVVKCSREGHVKVIQIQLDHRQKLQKSINDIILETKRAKHTAQQRKEIFNNHWQQWINAISEFENKNLYSSDHYIYTTIGQILRNTFKAHEQLIIQKLKLTPLSIRGECLELTIEGNIHVSSTKTYNRVKSAFTTNPFSYYYTNRKVPVSEEDIQDANIKTEEYLINVREQLENAMCKLQDYDPNVVDQIIMTLLQNIKKHDDKGVSYQFTPEYLVDISIVVASYAAKRMIEMVNKLRTVNSPITALSKLKPVFFRTFKSKFSAASNDQMGADNLAQLLSTSIHTALIRKLGIEIVDDMKVKAAHFQKKNYFKAQVLEDLVKSKEFNLFRTFLTDIPESFKYWAKIYVQNHCKEITKNNETRLTQLVKLHLETIISKLSEVVKELEKKYADNSENNNDDINTTTDIQASVTSDQSSISENHSDSDDQLDNDDDGDDEGDICINLWLEEFLENIKGIIMINMQEVQDMIGIKKLKNIKLFTNRFINKLNQAKLNIIKETEDPNSKLSKVSEWDSPPHLVLSGTLMGCKESCPFCKEQCEYTDESHEGNCHFTNIHRPSCLGRMVWVGTNKLCFDICSESVESDCNFKSSDTNDEYVPYKNYKTIYPNWVISNEKPKDGQTYWQWFCAKYNSEIVKWVGSKPTEVDSGWKKIKKEEAIRSLTLTYGAKVDT